MKTLTSFLLAVALLALPLRADVAGNQILGGQVTFSVTVGSGTPPLNFQWRKNGVAIPGATGATYVIASVSASDVGTYTVVVSNKAGSATSDQAVFTLTVIPGTITVQISTP